jgi:hypothetical protein
MDVCDLQTVEILIDWNMPWWNSIISQIVTGKITDKSYIPSGLTAAQYNDLRGAAVSKKKANYERNVKKAGIFEDYTDFYIKRGTDTKSSWKKDVTLGHRMAKTKYDWDKLSDKPLYVKTAEEKKKKAAAAKKAPVKKDAKKDGPRKLFNF